MGRIGNCLIIVFMALQLFSCTAGQNKKNINVKWRPGINAPKYYPCIIARGGFSDGKSYCPIASGVERNGGWGHGGLEMGTGEFIPNELSITWFSFAEDKFYGGTFSLPTDAMRVLFEQGCISAAGVKTKYQYMVVNAYPEGGVALWMKSSGGRCVEIGHFQAKEVESENL